MSSFIENISLTWTGDLVSLKQFSSEVLKLDGEWSQPGGDKKLFTFVNSTMVWRKNKNVLTINGERSEEIKKQICEVMLKDNLTLPTPPSQAQSSMTTDASLDLGLYSAGNYRTGHLPRRGLVYFTSSQISPITL
jgi:hypothetical protein